MKLQLQQDVHSEHNSLIICWKQLDATTVDATTFSYIHVQVT